MLGALQQRMLLGLAARHEIAGDTALVDDVDRRRAVGDAPVDAVAGIAGDLLDGRAERRQGPQDAVAQAVAGRARSQRLDDERRSEQVLLGTGDADGHRLGLVLDRVDGPR